MTIKLTAEECQNVSWTLEEETPHFRRYLGHGTHPATGLPITVRKTEYLAEDELLGQNANERNETDGQRWSSGHGSDKGGNMPLVKVASTPLNIFFDQMAPRLKEGDTDFVKWWLNRDENQPYRTKNGKV